MEKTEKIKRILFAFSTFGALGEWSLGGIIASVFAIPMLLLFRSIYWFNTTVFYWLIVLCAGLFVVAVQGAVQIDPERAKRAVVLDKLVGMMIAFVGVGLRWRVLFFGFVLFHLLNTLRPFIFYRKVIRYIERLPGVLGILGAEVLSGLIVNFLLHVIAWVMG